MDFLQDIQKILKDMVKEHPQERFFESMRQLYKMSRDGARLDLDLFWEGLKTEVGQGDFDFMEKEVIVLPYNSPTTCIVVNEQQFDNRSEWEGQLTDLQRCDIIPELKNEDVKREDLWRSVLRSSLISLPIDN
jgi:hypothetical protein